MSATRSLFRLAWRDVARNRARSLLVVVLVALPVAVMVGGSTLFTTTDPTPAQRATGVMGGADLVVSAPTGLGADSPVTALPAGSEVAPVGYADLLLPVDGRAVALAATAADLDGLAAGTLVLVDGSAPRAPGQLAVDAGLLTTLGAGIGDDLTFSDGTVRTVTGTVEDPELLSLHVAALPVGEPGVAVTDWLVELPPGSDEAGAGATLEEAGFLVLPRAEAAQRPGSVTFALFLFGGLAATEAALVAGAAFAVSTRRRGRELGLIAAAGGHARHLQLTVLGSGVVLGGLGAAIGAVCGLGTIMAVQPWLQGWANRLLSGITVNLPHVLGAALLGLAAAVVAAWLPARGAARLPVLVALSGRRPPSTPSRRSLVSGLVVITGSVALTALALVVGADQVQTILIMAGAILSVLGFGLTSPFLLERIGRLAGPLPIGPRLAVRDTARFRSRGGPLVTAILAGLAMSVAVGGVLASIDAVDRERYRPVLRTDQLVVAGPGADRVARAAASRGGAAVAAPLPGPVGAEGQELLAELRDDGGGEPLFELIAVAGADALGALGAEPAAVEALERGDTVFLGPVAPGAGDLRLRLVDAASGDGELAPSVGASLPVTAVPPVRRDVPDAAGALPRLVVPASALERLAPGGALDPEPRWVVRFEGTVPPAAVAEAEQLAASTGRTFVTVERGYSNGNEALARVVLGVALLTGLLVLAVALSLAAAETRADQRTLVEVGADPRLRRQVAAGRAAVLALLGGVLAVPAGLLPVWGLLRTLPDYDLVMPWTTIAVAGLLWPALAVVGAYALTRPNPRWTHFAARTG